MRFSDLSSDVCSSDLTRLTFVDIPKLAPVIIGPARRLLGIGVGYFETGQRPGAPVIGMNGHQMVEKLIAQLRAQVGPEPGAQPRYLNSIAVARQIGRAHV